MDPIQQAKVVAGVLGTQSKFWVPEDGTMVLPEANLLLGIIEQALMDLAWHHIPWSINDKSKRRERKEAAKDAHDFFATGRYRHITDLLELNPEWVRKIVRRWVRHLKKEYGCEELKNVV